MEILLIFKTHLDLGYTDLAAEVERRYMEEFIPHALDLAESMKDCDENFIWTTGSWLIEEALKRDDGSLSDAIRDGLIAWHALPFTTHTEYMNAALFRAGLDVAEDRQAADGDREEKDGENDGIGSLHPREGHDALVEPAHASQ